MGERSVRNAKVAGSIPVPSTRNMTRLFFLSTLLTLIKSREGDKQCNMAECSDEGISIERFEDDD